MKRLLFACALLLMVSACGRYTPTEPDPKEGYWSGDTDQERPISFYVTSQRTLGEIELKIELPDNSTIIWSVDEYEEFDEDECWSRDVEGESWYGGHVHTLYIEGEFVTADSCTGSFTAESETYHDGYYVQSEFSLSP